MEKKVLHNYEPPRLEVIEVEVENAILQASIPGVNDGGDF